MNGRERVLTTVAHREPDRVPVGEWGIDHDHVEKILGRPTYWRNRRGTTLALWQNRRDEVVDSLKRDYAELVETLDYDVVMVELVPSVKHHVSDPPQEVSEGVWKDHAGNVYKYAASNDSIFDVTPRECLEELTDKQIEEAIEKANEPIDPSCFELIDECCARYAGKRAIVCRSIDIYNPLFSPFHGDFSQELMLTSIAKDDLKRLHPACVAYNRQIIDHCARMGVDIMMQGQDFGMNSGCIIRPDDIREVFMPVIQQVNRDTIDAGMIPFFHCCGKVWDILDDFIAVGYQGYQSIQESAGMDNAVVKQKYGNRLTMWTGVQCETLVSGNLQQVEAEVLRNLELLMPGGGYLFGSTNSVQYGAKTENYLRALELVHKYGKY